MKRYKYAGPSASVTLSGGMRVKFSPGGELSLPEDNSYVRSLVAKGLLTEVKEAPAPPPKVERAPRSQRAPKTQRTPKNTDNPADAAADASKKGT